MTIERESFPLYGRTETSRYWRIAFAQHFLDFQFILFIGSIIHIQHPVAIFSLESDRRFTIGVIHKSQCMTCQGVDTRKAITKPRVGRLAFYGLCAQTSLRNIFYALIVGFDDLTFVGGKVEGGNPCEVTTSIVHRAHIKLPTYIGYR